MLFFYDTGMEFDAIYNLRDKVAPLIQEYGAEYVELKAEKSFEYYMFDREFVSRKGEIKKRLWLVRRNGKVGNEF